MILINSENYNEEFLKQYFECGYLNYEEFYDSQNWRKIKQFEIKADEVIQNYKITNVPDGDMLKAKESLMKYASSLVGDKPINYLEFGVRKGISFNWALKHFQNPQSLFYGFDTFEGLPETWVSQWGGSKNPYTGERYLKGKMKAAIPSVEDERGSFYKGLFQDTLPNFLKNTNISGRKYINIDSDIYTGALFVLTVIHFHLEKGDFIYFDEFHDTMNEFAAFNDYIRSYYLKDKFKLIARAYDGYLFEYTG